MKQNSVSRLTESAWFRWPPWALALAACCSAGLAEAAPVVVSLGPSPSGLPGDLRISWSSVPSSVYLVQSATNLSAPGSWNTFDAVTATNGSSFFDLSAAGGAAAGGLRFYRLILPQPQLQAVEPAFVNSGDSNAVLYLLGQALPVNATVVIDGQNFSPTIINSNGVWATVNLSGLQPGTVLSGQISVFDKATSNEVATLVVQSPLVYGPALSSEQLQGPPEEPGASARRKHDAAMAAIQNTHRDLFGGGTGPGLPGIAVSDEVQLGDKKSPKHHSIIAAGGAGDTGGGGGIGVPGIAVSDQADPGEKKPAKHRASILFGGGGGVGSGAPGIAVSDQAQPADKKDLKHHGIIASAGGRDLCGSTPHLLLATGEFRQTMTDLAVPGRGLDFIWTRTYRSRTGPTTVQGAGWDFSYNVSLAVQPNGTVLLNTGDGRSNTFYPNGTNGWSRDEYFVTVGDLNGDGMPDVLFPDGGKWLFNPLGTVAAGKLASIVDRNGNTISLGYDGSGRLTTIVDTLGRTNTVGYNSTGQLASVTDFSGRTVSYGYDGNGDLVSCVSPAVTGTPNGNDFPDGKTNLYSYSSGFTDERLNHNLTGCSDGLGQNWLQIVYQTNTDPASIDFDAVDHLQEGQYFQFVRRYAQTPSPTNGFAVVKAIYSDAVGDVSECYYDSRQRCLRELDYTGRSNPFLPVTETANRPAGKLRASDPDTYETIWTWNPDSLCTGVFFNPGTRPRGAAFVYERELSGSADARKKGDLRVARELAGEPVDTNGDGTPDTTERSWRFDYDPRFGSPGGALVLTGPVTKGRKDMLQWVSAAAASGAGHSGNMAGNHKDVMMAVVKKSGGSHGSNMSGNHKDLMLALAAGSGTAHTSSMAGNHKDLMEAVVRGSSMAGNHKDCGTAPFSDNAAAKDVVAGDVNGDGRMDFWVSATDPNGHVTSARYDGQGDCLHFEGPLGAQMDFAYNSFGQLTSCTNAPDGNGYRSVDAFSYYGDPGAPAGYLQSWTADAYGLALSSAFKHDERGNVTRLIDPRGNDYLATYNALDQLVEFQTPTNINTRCTTDYFYDADNNLVQLTTELRDANDVFQHAVYQVYAYDFLDRRVAVTQQVAVNQFVTNGISYDGNGNITAWYSPLAMSGADPNHFTLFAYDERNLPWKQVDAPPNPALARTNQWDYDLDGNCIQLTSSGSTGQPETTSMAYDGFDRRVSVTDAMGNVETGAFDRSDCLAVDSFYGETNDVAGSAGNRLLAQVFCQYDPGYRLTAIQAARFDAAGNRLGPGYALTQFAYAPNGQLLSVTDANQHITAFGYDTAGRCDRRTDAKNNQVQFAYDACDNLTTELSVETPDFSSTAEQFSLSYSYDSQNRCVARADNVGNTVSCAYDSLDRAVRSTDPNGRVRWAIYDDLGRCTVAVADLDEDGVLDLALDAKTAFAWDDNSRCVARADANTNVTYYAYDSLDRCLAITNADHTASLLTYDSFDNLITLTDPNGTAVTNAYDQLNRLVHRDISARNLVVSSTTFEDFGHDGLGRLVWAKNDNSDSAFAYDSQGNCLACSQDGLVTACTYDGVGDLLSITYPSGRRITYTYDPLDEMTSVSSGTAGAAGTTLVNYSYEGPGRLGKILRANGIGTRITWDGLDAPANGAGDFGWRQVSAVHHGVAATLAPLDARSFAYDRNQNKTARAQTAPFFSGGPLLTNSFAYDALDRLTGFQALSGSTLQEVQTYTLDANGNRQAASSNGVALAYDLQSAIPPGDFEMNRYTTTPYGSQTYDANGNLVTRATTTQSWRYSYDYANRLVEVDSLASGALTPLVSFSYDALGRRVHKVSYSAAPAAAVTNDFIYGGTSVLERYQDGALDRSFAYGRRLESGRDPVGVVADMDEDGRNDLVASIGAGGLATYYLCDDLGSVLALTDPQGTVVERCDYDAYGAPRFMDAQGKPLAVTESPAGNPFLFRAMQWGGETSLYWSGPGDESPSESLALESSSGEELPKESITSGMYLDPQIGRGINAYTNDKMSGTNPFYEAKDRVFFPGDNAYGFSGSNPWSQDSAAARKKKTSKGDGFHGVVRTIDLASP